MLTVNGYHTAAYLTEHGECHGPAVDARRGAPVRRNGPLEKELPLLRVKPVLFCNGFGSLADIGKHAAYRCLTFSGTDQFFCDLSAHKESDAVDQDGFTGACLARENGQSIRKGQVGSPDNGNILNV